MTLYFENSYGLWRPIADCANKVEVATAIKRFLDEHNFKSYYTRVWDSDGWRHYDVGSHTEFFHWQISSEAKVVPAIKIGHTIPKLYTEDL